MATPSELLDLSDPAVLRDPYPHLAALRAHDPFVWHEGLQAHVASGHAQVSAALRDRRLGRVYRDREPAQDWATFNWLHADSILDSEPPKHTRLRRLVAGAFGRGHVARLEPRIRAIAEELVDAAGRGSFDLVEAVAEPLPVTVIAELLDWPHADRHLLRPWSQAIVAMYEVDPSEQARAEALRASSDFAAYVDELAAHRARHPGEDLLTDLVQARDAGDALSRHELVATVVLLLNAGHEASVNGLSNGIHSWITAGSPAVDVEDDAALALLVEELLRHDSPLHLFERTATADLEVDGRPVAEGERVHVLLGAANRDPAVFAEPDRFDPRRDPNPHLAFGLGIHFCIGAPLARLELQQSVRALLRRHPRLEVVEAVRRPTFVLRGFERLVLADA